jgi:hypothetical protein
VNARGNSTRYRALRNSTRIDRTLPIPTHIMPPLRTRPGPRRLSPVILCLGLTVAVLALQGGALGQQPHPGPFGALEQCQRIKDEIARLHCYEGVTSKPDPTSKSQSTGVGNWRLVRTPNPAGGADAVSIMQTADIAKSDLDLAGLMFRCGERNVETLVVLVRPFPPRAHPKVTAGAGGRSGQFTATVVPPGSALLLPPEASSLAAGPWQSSPELAVEVADENPIRGVIALAGLGPAYRMLVANCRSQ